MRVPEWQGWVVLGGLVLIFAALTWWIFLSPLATADGRGAGRTSARARQWVSVAVLGAGVLFVVGARWDELWHRQFGGFGDDFLWPPHLVMYVGLGLNAIFAVAGLATATRGRRHASGGIRARFRAEPGLGLLGLMAAFQMVSIPSDLLWHQIIGPDLTAWSLPHLVLALTTTAVLLAAIVASRALVRTWGWWCDLVTVGLLATSQVALLQIGTTEWDWATTSGEGILANRPAWAYPVITLTVGLLHGVLARVITGRIGAASIVAAIGLVVQATTVVVARAVYPPGPVLITAEAIAYGSVAMDLWWGYRRRSTPVPMLPPWARPQIASGEVRGGAITWVAAFALLGLPALALHAGIPTETYTWTFGVLSCMGIAVATAWIAEKVGTWLARLGFDVGEVVVPTARPIPDGGFGVTRRTASPRRRR